MRNLSLTLTVILVVASSFFAGCGSKLPAVKPYKMEIQQGNVVNSKMLLQLRPGMTKSQVLYIMGTPLIADSFHSNRWDYFYQMRKEGKLMEQRRVILDFDKDALVSVRGDVVAASDKSAEAPVNTAPRTVTPPKKEETSFWDKLKFWGGDETAPKTAGVAPVEKAPATAKVEAAESLAQKTPSGSEEKAAAGTGIVLAAPVAEGLAQESAETASILKKNIELPVAKEEVVTTAVTPELSAPEALAPEAQANVSEPVKPAEAEKVPEVAKPEAAKPESQPIPTAQVAAMPVTKPSNEASQQAVQGAVDAWANAWRGKDITAYLSAYSAKFKPDGLATRAAWVAQRKNRLSKKQGDIRLALEDVTVNADGTRATVQFFQKYSSKVYSDEVAKQLDFEWDAKANRWLIVKESVIENAQRAHVQKVIAPDETSEHLDGVIEKIGF